VPTVDLRIKDALKGVAPPEPMAHGVPIADLRLKERMPRKREILTVAAPYRVDLMKHAGRTLTLDVGGERALFEALTAAAERSEPGTDAALSAVAAQFVAAERAVVILGAQVLASKGATAAALAFARAVGARTMLLGPMANSYGLEASGVLPSHERYAFPTMLDDARALIVSNLDPARHAGAAEALGELDLLVVHGSFESATTALADVVLPAKTGFEKEGTVVNLEGRYLPVRPAPVEGGLSEDLTGVVRRLGEALGVRLDGRSVRSARRALKRRLEIDLAAIPDHGLLAPARPRRSASVSVQGSDERAGEVLLVPTMLRYEHLDRNRHLRAAHGDSPLRLHPADAAERGLASGDAVRLTVGGVARRARVQPSEGVPQGLLLLPALPEQAAGRALLEPGSLAPEREAEVTP
jgi:NADH-quinone oxidoreductase subunit G